jgi:hypothetical protein
MSQEEKVSFGKKVLRSLTGSRLVLLSLLVVVLLLALSFFGSDEALLLPQPEPPKTEKIVSTEKREMPVYILSTDKRGLEQISRPVKIYKETALSVKSLMNLYAGDDKIVEDLFPDETVIRSVFVYADIAYISFDSSIRKKFNGGTRMELLALQAIAWSVIENFEEINGVQFLIDDAPSDIFVAHVDISRPYRKPVLAAK